ncbi:MAG: hypothetical protein WCZ47_00555 [Bacilli bacterium]|nr:hypothetical protein [Bacilli bacterium]NLN80718.1 hypothetical protein [Erysipelotrichia bacterium]
MARKKSNKKTNKNAFLLSGVLLLVALVLWFVLPAVSRTPLIGDDISYTFLQSTFGYKEVNTEIQVFNFNIAGLLGLIFLVLALVVSVYHFVAKKSVLGGLAHFVVLVLGVAAGVLVLLSKTTLQIELVTIDPNKVHLAIGSYIVGPLAIVGGVIPFAFKLIK